MGSRRFTSTGTFSSRWARRKRWHFNKRLEQSLCKICDGGSICDYGAGIGRYVLAFRQHGFHCDGYDGIKNIATISNGVVQEADLTQRIDSPVYDWVLCLETAEHIPRKHEPVFLDNLVRHARLGIAISWAPPGQRGLGHVNCRPVDYVIDVFSKRNWAHDEATSSTCMRLAGLRMRSRNVMIFRPSAKSL